MKLNLILLVFLVSISSIPLEKISSTQAEIDALNKLTKQLEMKNKIFEMQAKTFKEKVEKIMERFLKYEIETIPEEEYNKIKLDFDKCVMDFKELPMADLVDLSLAWMPDYKDRIEFYYSED